MGRRLPVAVSVAVAIGAAIALLVAACSDSSPSVAADAAVSDAPPPDAGGLLATGTMSAEIDGDAWNATTVTAVNMDGVIAIGGDDGAGRIVGIGVLATQPGTYQVASDSSTDFTLNDGGAVFLATLTNGSGSVTIISLSATRITGTFLFVAEEAGGNGERTVTNGMFDLEL